MLAGVKKDLKKMKVDRPGQRFRNHHRRSAEKGGGSVWERVFFISAAAVSFAIGVVLVVFPGPAFVFFIISGALLASQWRPVAVFMDRAELAVRDAWKWLRKKWAARPAWLGSHSRSRVKTHAARH